MFKKIKEFFSKSPTTEAAWPFPTSRPNDIPIITPEPINAMPVPLPPAVEPKVTKQATKAPATKTVTKSTKAPPKPPVATKPTKPITTTKRSPGRPSKKP